MSDFSSSPDWTDHDVGDPGVTLLGALVYGLAAFTLVAGATAVVRRRRRERTGASC